MLLIGLPFGIRLRSGFFGYLLLVGLVALWAAIYSGFMQLIALKSRSSAATQAGGMAFFPLLFLTPNFVPRNLLSRPMEIAATINPVTYLMEAIRSLVIKGIDWPVLGRGFLVIALAMALMLTLNVRAINSYD